MILLLKNISIHYFIFILLPQNVCFSQPSFRFEHFTTEHGLSENFIYTVFQDSRGFLWIGTHDGLNRYDGYNFKVFRQSPADSNSLPDNTINAINEDDKGNIWIGTNKGLCILNPFTNQFYKVVLPQKIVSVAQILKAQRHEYLISSPGGFILINTSSFSCRDITVDTNSKKMYAFYSLAKLTQDHMGNIYTASNVKGFINAWKYDSTRLSFTDFMHLPLNEDWNNDVVRTFYPDKKNTAHIILIHSEIISIPVLPKYTGTKITPHFTQGMVNHIYEDKEFNLWVSTTEGLKFINTTTGAVQVFRNSSTANSISSNNVLSVLQDKTGILWIATANGLNKLNPEHRWFTHITTTKNELPALADNFVFGIFSEPNDNVRIHYNTTDSKLSRLSLRNNTISNYIKEEYDVQKWLIENCFLNPERLTDSLRNKAIKFLKINSDRGESRSNGKILVDKEKKIWYIGLGTIYSLETGKLFDFDYTISDLKYFNNELWIATPGSGLFCFDLLSKKIATHFSAHPSADSLNSGDITSLFMEPNGNIWIGSKGGGLNYFNRQKKTFTHFTETDGLCNNSIYCIVKDDTKDLWLGTSNGLSCFNTLTKKFRNYYRADGLINSEYNRNSACKLPDGRIMMGGINGIDLFHPDSLKNTNHIPVVQITGFKVFDKNIYSEQPPRFRNYENVVTIEFAAMDFGNRLGNKFSYKLEGTDKDWIMAGNRNFTTYSNLQPGSYRFLVKAANSDGVWNEIPAEYRFTILPAWYQTWLFKIAAVLLIVSLVYFLFRYRLQQRLRVLQIRNRLHRDLHDDVGATLSSVKAYSEILKDNPDNPVIAELIKDNSAEMLERLDVIAWATNPAHDNFLSLKNKMTKFAVPLCKVGKIECSIESNGLNDELQVPGEIRQSIFLVFKEAITNIIKYAEASSCIINLFIQNRNFIMLVKDNGKGSDGNIKGSGNGWANMKKRAEELNGSLAIESQPGKGTTISFFLPYPFRIPNTWDRNKR